MPRVVSLFLPRWPIDRLRRAMGVAAPPPEVPLVLVGRDGRKRVVTALNQAAESLGLRAGMAVAKAQALAPGLVVKDADAGEDAAALERLALWALQRISPMVAADPPDGLVIDTTGADHLHGGEEIMLAAIVKRSVESGVEARAAVAGSWGTAHAMARFLGAASTIAPVGRDEGLLWPLPIAALAFFCLRMTTWNRFHGSMYVRTFTPGFQRQQEGNVRTLVPVLSRGDTALDIAELELLGRLTVTFRC